MEKVKLSDKPALFSNHFSPKVVGELNGQQVKQVKFKGSSFGLTMKRRTSCSM